MKVRELSDWVSELIERTKEEFDNLIIVESGSVKGTGKSTFSLLSDIEITKQMGYNFSLEESVVFDPTNEKIVELVKHKPIAWPVHIDEGSKVAYKRNFAKEEQKDLIIFVNVCRKHNKIIFLNNPSFWGLDKDLLDLADYRVTILKRGLALVRGKVKNPEAVDKWARKETDDLIKKMVKNEMSVDEVVNAIRRAPNYLFEINFGTAPAEIYQKYKEISKEAELERFYATRKTDNRMDIITALVSLLGFVRKYWPITYEEITSIVNEYLKQIGKPGNLSLSWFDQTESYGRARRINSIIEARLKQKFDIAKLVLQQGKEVVTSRGASAALSQQLRLSSSNSSNKNKNILMEDNGVIQQKSENFDNLPFNSGENGTAELGPEKRT